MPDAAAVVAAADTGDFQVTIKNTGTGVITIARTTALDTIDGTAADITLGAKKSVSIKGNQAGTGYNVISSAPSIEYGTYTFSSVAAGATPVKVDIAHSLGTDNIDFNMTVRGSPYSVANGSYNVSAVAMRPDGGGFMVNTDTAPTAQPGIISLPASGNFALRIRNDSSVTQDVIVDYTLTARG